MKTMTILLICMISLLVTACQPAPPAAPAPTIIPFPTMTVGHSVEGAISPANFASVTTQDEDDQLANPATAVALANRATATPDLNACPTRAFEARLAERPDTRDEATAALLDFLNAGGTVQALGDALATEWDAFDEASYLRDTTDLTGEGAVEIVLGYTSPGDVGTLLVIGCRDGQYTALYDTIADGLAPPEIIWLGDINRDPLAELVFARRQCLEADTCEVATQILAWDGRLGRFVNLLQDTLLTLDVPSVNDVDDDQVAELVVNYTSNGTAATGPLRTGLNIYDWDGSGYVLSIVQWNAPRYRIQIVHQGDRAFSQLNFAQAARLYASAIEDDTLRYWFNDGPRTTISYALYRLILATAVSARDDLPDLIQQLNETFPVDAETTVDDYPVYVEMAYTFLNTLSDRNDLHLACAAVQTIIENDDSALNLINRFGERNPQYTALDLCPF